MGASDPLDHDHHVENVVAIRARDPGTLVTGGGVYNDGSSILSLKTFSIATNVAVIGGGIYQETYNLVTPGLLTIEGVPITAQNASKNLDGEVRNNTPTGAVNQIVFGFPHIFI